MAKQRGVSLTSSRRGDENEITFSGLTEEEVERLRGWPIGHWWVKVEDGRLSFGSARNAPPGPADDEEMMPFWRERDSEQPAQLRLFEDDADLLMCPSFQIQSVCGYDYTPEFYFNEVRKLERYGFVCLRSRRDDSGRFYEIWHLPGCWLAKGELAEAVSGFKTSEEKTKAVIRFLCENVSFGTLDVGVQRAAMRIND
jgi:hypothetical protein